MARGEPIGRVDVEGAMTFDEIAEAEGITRGGAYMAYASAMRKLRKKKPAFLFLLEMHHELQQNRHTAAHVGERWRGYF